MGDTFNERLRLIRFRRKRERAKFTEELRIIPRWLVGTCAFLWLVAVGIGVSLNIHNMRYGGDVFPPELRDQPALATFALGALITAISVLI